MEPDGRTVWTAHHCVVGLGLVDPPLRDIAVGETRPCGVATGLRAVSLLGLTKDDFTIPPDLIVPCESISRPGVDLVRVVLSSPLPVPLADRAPFGHWRHLRPGEADTILVPGRRVYALGYLQSANLHEMMGGSLFSIEYCAQTLAGFLPGFSGQSPPAALVTAGQEIVATAGYGAMQHDGFACFSSDTLNGGSGGPVFAVDDTGTELILIGIISGAAWVNFDMECGKTTGTPLEDSCGAEPDGLLNVMALLPEG